MVSVVHVCGGLPGGPAPEQEESQPGTEQLGVWSSARASSHSIQASDTSGMESQNAMELMESVISSNLADPNAVVRRQEALEASRRRMQEELDAKAALFRLKQQQLEEEKRQQKIEMYDSMKEGRSYRGKSKTAQNTEEASTSTTVLKPKTDKKPLRSSGFNPLSGEGGGSCAWRPGRRGPSAGGG
uniref:Selenoprotein S n=1 Tax=Oncorhynchus tshawytscha TaxID=74940 RepID=A0AAZ3QI32_ONCTS